MSEEPNPLDELEQAVQAAKANRETREKELEGVPQWRFRRRRQIERAVRRRQVWEERLEEHVRERSAGRT